MFLLVPMLIFLVLHIFPNCSIGLLPVALPILLWISLLPSLASVSTLHRYTNSLMISLFFAFTTNCSSSMPFQPLSIAFAFYMYLYARFISSFREACYAFLVFSLCSPLSSLRSELRLLIFLSHGR